MLNGFVVISQINERYGVVLHSDSLFVIYVDIILEKYEKRINIKCVVV